MNIIKLFSEDEVHCQIFDGDVWTLEQASIEFIDTYGYNHSECEFFDFDVMEAKDFIELINPKPVSE